MIADNLVEIAAYSFPHEAHVVKASLDAAGIPAFLTDEYTVNVQWMYSNALGGVRLLVHSEDVEAAIQILATDFSDSLENGEWMESATPAVDEEELERCPSCGSADLSPHVAGRLPVFVTWMLLGIPLFFFKHGMKCGVCGKFMRL